MCLSQAWRENHCRQSPKCKKGCGVEPVSLEVPLLIIQAMSDCKSRMLWLRRLGVCSRMNTGLGLSSMLRHRSNADDVAHEAEQIASRLTVHRNFIMLEGSVTGL